jgi:hypothetical protein
VSFYSINLRAEAQDPGSDKRLFAPERSLWGLREELEGRREVITLDLAQDNGPEFNEKYFTRSRSKEKKQSCRTTKGNS